MIIAFYGYRGAGKTLSMAHHILEDLQEGRKLFTNMEIKNIPKALLKNVTLVPKKDILNFHELIIKKPKMLFNATIAITELHNYIDSRSSMSKENKMFSYWVLQSRHTGEGTVKIYFDTQKDSQVDIRMRENVDHEIYPSIVRWTKERHKKPVKVLLTIISKVRQEIIKSKRLIDVTNCRNIYDTHEVIQWW